MTSSVDSSNQWSHPFSGVIHQWPPPQENYIPQSFFDDTAG